MLEIRSTGTVRETAQQVRRVILEDPACFATWNHKELYPVDLRRVLLEERELWRGYMPELPADVGRLLLLVECDSWTETFTIEAVPGGALVRAEGWMVYTAGQLPGLDHARRSIRPPHPAAVALLERIAAELGRLGMLADQAVDQAVDQAPAAGIGAEAERDALIIRLWNENYTGDEVAEWPGVNLSPGRLRNRLTELRKRFGAERVHFHRRGRDI